MSLSARSVADEPHRDDTHVAIEKRYRSSRYFLEDQLRHSDAVEDFRTVKQLLASVQSFGLNQLFRFAAEPVVVTVEAR
jgi:hypothetical protein